MKTLLLTIAICFAAFAAETNQVATTNWTPKKIQPRKERATNEVARLPSPDVAPDPVVNPPAISVTAGYSFYWGDNGTNLCEAFMGTNVTTLWLALEELPHAQGKVVKQIGVLVTNRVLTVIHDGQTNELVLRSLGREEWPSQHRTVLVQNPGNGPQNK